MSQKIFGLGLGGSGIVGVLIVAGMLLNVSGVEEGTGIFAIKAGVFIGIMLGLLGVVSVIGKVIK